MTIINKQNYPKLHYCWLQYRLDNGIINRLEPEEESFQTVESLEIIQNAESALSTFSEEQLDFLVNGEEGDRHRFIRKHNLYDVEYLFTEWWGE